MGEVISVISGKGGTGKTTICAAVATCLAVDGKRVLCIDADIGLRNLDIALGMAELPLAAFTDVLHGHCNLSDAAEHPQFPGLFLLTAPVRENEDLISADGFRELLDQARRDFDFCLIDAPAGIGAGFRLATRFADRCLVISTPDPASMRDAGCAADLLILDGKETLQLIVNRCAPRMFSKMELTVDDIMDDVGLPSRPTGVWRHIPPDSGGVWGLPWGSEPMFWANGERTWFSARRSSSIPGGSLSAG